MSVSHWTTPENSRHAGIDLHHARRDGDLRGVDRDLRRGGDGDACASSLIELPLLSSIVTWPGPSLSVTFCAPGVSTMNCSWPSSSSSVSLHAVFRADDFAHVASAGDRLRRGVAAVPQTADDDRITRVAVDENDEHLVADVRDQKGAAIVPRKGGGDARPDRTVVTVDAVEVQHAHLHARESVSGSSRSITSAR